MTMLKDPTGAPWRYGKTRMEKSWDFLSGTIPTDLVISYPVNAGTPKGAAAIDTTKGFPTLTHTTAAGNGDRARIDLPITLDSSKLKVIELGVTGFALEGGGTNDDGFTPRLLLINGSAGIQYVHRNYATAELAYGSPTVYTEIRQRSFGVNGGQKIGPVMKNLTLRWEIARGVAILLEDGHDRAEVPMPAATHGLITPAIQLQTYVAAARTMRLAGITLAIEA